MEIISEYFDEPLQPDNEFPGFTENMPDEDTRIKPAADKKWVRCVKCSNKIALVSDKININGADTHLFKNPAGIYFTVICFSSASGAVNITQHTEENTWFPGCPWSISICGFCGNHLGWHYLSETGDFYGLITYRLTGV
jgi:hypothetical protein